MHAICLWRDSDGALRGYAHIGASSGQPAKNFTLPAEASHSLEALREGLESGLGLRKPSNDWGHLDYKQDFGLFDLQGWRLSASDAALRAGRIMLLEGGQWMWPPVRVGHTRSLGAGLKLETLSLEPVVLRLKGFLRRKECRRIIKAAAEMSMNPSAVLRRGSDNYRTSSDTRLETWNFTFLEDIDERVASVTRVPREQHEDVQVARFEADQYYALHADAYDPAVHPSWDFIQHGHKNRFITMLWYLVDVKDGGHTLFPRAMGLPEPEDIHACDKGLKVSPKRGSAIIFYNLYANGNFNPHARHAGCPPKRRRGKWSANKWIWNKPVPQRRAEDMLGNKPAPQPKAEGMRTK